MFTHSLMLNCCHLAFLLRNYLKTKKTKFFCLFVLGSEYLLPGCFSLFIFDHTRSLAGEFLCFSSERVMIKHNKKGNLNLWTWKRVSPTKCQKCKLFPHTCIYLSTTKKREAWKRTGGFVFRI